MLIVKTLDVDGPAPTGLLLRCRAVVTMADRYTGPAGIERFEAEGASVIADVDGHLTAAGPQAVIEAARQPTIAGERVREAASAQP